MRAWGLGAHPEPGQGPRFDRGSWVLPLRGGKWRAWVKGRGSDVRGKLGKGGGEASG